MYIPSVFFQDKLMLYVFESLKRKEKKSLETQIGNAWNLDFNGGINGRHALCDAFYTCF